MTLGEIVEWLDRPVAKHGPKIVVGPRYTGKSAALQLFRARLLERGIAAERIVYLDGESIEVRRHSTDMELLNCIRSGLPVNCKCFILIDEAMALPSPELVLGTLSAIANYELFIMSSTKRIITGGLGDYLSGNFEQLELPPAEFNYAFCAETKPVHRWYERLLSDVIIGAGVADAAFAERMAGYLSDHQGEAISLRSLSAALSPRGRMISPHTIEQYLTALEEAFLVVKVLKIDLPQMTVKNFGYRYFFMDTEMRLARFGAALTDESRRVDLVKGYFQLRQRHKNVYFACGRENVDFVASENGKFLYWKVDNGGECQSLNVE